MKKITLNFMTIIMVGFFMGCADKKPFSPQAPLKNSALVYVYAKQVTLNSDTSVAPHYKIYTNDSLVQDITLKENEYIALDLVPQKTKISAVVGSIISHDIILDLKDGAIYYLRLQVKNESDFTFEQLDENIANKEIKKTKLSGSFLEEKNENLVEKSQDENQKSKLDKIKEANELKEKGVITDEEFAKLKNEILEK